MTITINGTTGIAGVDGSAGTPAVQGTDTNTGVFFGTDTVTISTGGTAAVTVDSGQRTKFPTTIGVGGATPSTSGSGISFPATASASSDANTLDDYEEGTFTPTIIGATTAGTGTYSTQVGTYTKVGRAVSFQIDIGWSAHTGTGDMQVSGLPFTSSPAINTAVTVGFASNVALTASNILIADVNTNAVIVVLRQTPTGGGAVTTVPIDTAARIMLSSTYNI
jgi:hypothetical protein